MIRDHIHQRIRTQFKNRFLRACHEGATERQILDLQLATRCLILFITKLLNIFIYFTKVCVDNIPRNFYVLFTLTTNLTIANNAFCLDHHFNSCKLRGLVTSHQRPQHVVRHQTVQQLLHVHGPQAMGPWSCTQGLRGLSLKVRVPFTTHQRRLRRLRIHQRRHNLPHLTTQALRPRKQKM